MGEVGIERPELFDILLAEIARRLHAGEQDGKPARLQLGDDLFQRRLGRRRIKALKRVVGAELDDDAARVVRQRPIEPGKPCRRRVSRHAGIDYLHLLSARFERLLELGGKRIAVLKAESRGQAVAEGDDHRRAGHCPNCHAARRGEEHSRGNRNA